MTAIIYDINTQSTYVSPIFAIRTNHSEVIALTPDRSGVKRIKMWNPRCVYIVEHGEFDCTDGKWRGYDWVIGNENLRKSLKYGRTASIEDFPEFKKMTKKSFFPSGLSLPTSHRSSHL